MEQYLWLIPVGFVVGALGTLIGAGGGFILVPTLLLVYPHENPETITSITLAVVFFNALSGSWTYARMGRIDYKSGLIFSAATMPGAILGALSTAYIPRRLFDGIFGLLMIAMSALLLFGPGKRKLLGEAIPALPAPGRTFQQTIARFFPGRVLGGIGLSIVVGYLSTLLGIGAGFIYVPAFVYFLDFPVRVATATSQFILAVTALSGTVTHVATGLFHRGARRTIALSIGVILGAQLGARFSEKVKDDWIIRVLALAIGFVGVRILLEAF